MLSRHLKIQYTDKVQGAEHVQASVRWLQIHVTCTFQTFPLLLIVSVSNQCFPQNNVCIQSLEKLNATFEKIFGHSVHTKTMKTVLGERRFFKNILSS